MSLSESELRTEISKRDEIIVEQDEQIHALMTEIARLSRLVKDVEDKLSRLLKDVKCAPPPPPLKAVPLPGAPYSTTVKIRIRDADSPPWL